MDSLTTNRRALSCRAASRERPLADREVLQFVQAHLFHPADFTIRNDGVCRLNPEMARFLTRNVLDFSRKHGVGALK
jgi:hypothetical protein